MKGTFFSPWLRLGLCSIQFQSADRHPWQNISWKVNSCWTRLCTTNLSPVRSNWPIVQSSFPAKSLFSRCVFNLFNHCLPHQYISRHFSCHVVNLFKHCVPRQFIYRHLNVPLFPYTRGSKWLIGNPIGRSDWARKRVSNRSSDWTVQLVTDPIDQSKNLVWCDFLYGHRVVQSHRLAASTAQSSIWDSLWSDRIRLLGLQSPSLNISMQTKKHLLLIKL